MNAEDIKSKTVAVIDGNSLMHRAYHAVPPTMNAPDGTPTNAVFGFLSMLIKFIELSQPDAIICAFDAGKPKFRMEALEQYKAQRPPMDNELRVQFPLIENLLESMNIPVVKVPGWEGDDILGTIAARDEALGYKTLLVTGDKDACQLASELTSIVTTKKGITDIDVMSPERVIEKYGIAPDRFPDYLGLMGDSSDNIPGVPGVGAKTAVKYLQEYGSIEGLYEHADEIKGKTGEKVRAAKDLAFLSRQIATIVRDLDFELDLEGIAWPNFDVERVTESFDSMGMRTHLRKVLGFAEEVSRGGVACAASQVELVWNPVVEGEEAFAQLDAALCTDELLGLALSDPLQASLFTQGTSLAVNTGKGTLFFREDDATKALADIVRRGRFSAFDVKACAALVYPRDTAEPCAVQLDDLMRMRAFDVSLAAYVLDSLRSDFSPAALMDAHCASMLPEFQSEEEGAALHAAAARALVEPLRAALESDDVLSCFEDIDMPLVAVLASMERTGATIDVNHLNQLGRDTAVKLDELRARIVDLAGHDFNLDSPKQLSTVLFEELGLTPLKKTQRGYSTDASVLKELAKEHELPALVMSYRELAKIKSTYIDALPPLRAEGDWRIHTSFNETVTATGRLSSSDPNLQNIPVRTEFGRQIRECFVPLHEGEVFLSADYSQIELRLLAHLSGDEGLINAFLSGEDFHAATAARVFGLDPREVTPEQRSRAKAVNFGIVYGQQAYGLSQSLDIPFGEAKDMIDAYFAAYPGVRSYLDRTVEEARANGFATTMFGRKRHIPELQGNAIRRGFGERTAMNHPMQGSAADIIKLSMRRVQEKLIEGGFEAQLLLQVHDELDFSVPREEVERLSALVKEVMENVAALRVPLLVDISWGDTWAQAH